MKKAIVHTRLGKFTVNYEWYSDGEERNLLVFYVGDDAVMSFVYTDIVIEWK